MERAALIDFKERSERVREVVVVGGSLKGFRHRMCSPYLMHN